MGARRMLGDKLLAKQRYDCEGEIRTLELLKLRFGDANLHRCEVGGGEGRALHCVLQLPFASCCCLPNIITKGDGMQHQWASTCIGWCRSPRLVCSLCNGTEVNGNSETKSSQLRASQNFLKRSFGIET